MIKYSVFFFFRFRDTSRVYPNFRGALRVLQRAYISVSLWEFW
jgi:hypothetical protein